MNATTASPFPALSDVADLFDDDPQFARYVRRAEILSHARGLPRWLKGNPVDLVLVLLAGQDLGLTTWEAINSFYPDDSEESGLALYASAQRALLHRAGWTWRIVEATRERCTVAVTDPDRPHQGEILTTYTMQDALVAELTTGPRADFWRRHPERMLYARVTTLIVNAHASHVVRGAPRGWGTLLTADPAPLPVAAPETAPPPAPDSTPTTIRPLQDPLPTPDLGNEARTPHNDTTTESAPTRSTPPAHPTRTHHPATTPAPTKEPTPPDTDPDDRTKADPPGTNRTDDRTAVPDRTSPVLPAQPPATPEPGEDRGRSHPEQPNAVATDAPDPRQAAWAVLRHMADVHKPNGVNQILLGNPQRIAKLKASGKLTDRDEQLIRQAHRTLGNSAHAIYRQLRKPDAPSVAEPDRSPPTPLRLAPRAQMPDLCRCENAQDGDHRDDCPDAAQ
ncbi:hypothetical protein ACFC58_41400 [Kitasatospora purpeofusca]|uniref:hypothetical protein n=1 Tax=Kitasatospora purpeofusca TaxID=67352 RepID=UPI0035D8C40D